MFDPRQPNNSLPHLPPSSVSIDDVMMKKLLSASRALAQLDGIDHINQNYISDMMIKPFLVSESIHSNDIENIHTTIESYYQEEITSKELTGNNKEVDKYKEAIMYGYNQIQKNEMLLTRDIVAIQHILEPNKPGIQSSPDKRIQNSKTKEVIYTPPQGQDLLLDLMGNLDTYINDNSLHDIDPLIKTIVIHYQFESIHPFLDGNGRTGRIIMVLYLVMQGLISLPILFVSGYINTHKDAYYEHLRTANHTGDLRPLILYLLTAIETQSLSTIQKIIDIHELIDHMNDKAHKAGIKDHQSLITLFVQKPYFTLSSVAEDSSISERTLRRRFDDLKQAGIIKQSAGSQGSYIYYELVGLLPILTT